MPRIHAKQVDGLVLSVDAKKLDKYLVLDGKNFLLDAEGPRSAFGFTCTHRSLANSEFVTSVLLAGTTFYLAHSTTSSVVGVFTLNWGTKQFIHQFNIPEISADADKQKYPWTTARVGGKYYICHLAFGIWQYDAILNSWTNYTTNIKTDLGGTPDIYGITESGGRLIALITGWVAWSAIDDGTDFVPSLVTGAGAQSLALIGTPTTDYEYKGLYKVADGFLTATQFGVLKSTLIDSINPFRHDPLSDEHIPFNQNCATQIATNTWIFLTKTGLYITTGKDFQVWQPLMSEYLKLREIPTLSLNEIGQVQLYYHEERQWFFISLSRTRNVNFFSIAYAIYLPRDEWGVFNSSHRSFVSVDEFDDASRNSLGFIDLVGRLCLFSDTTDNILLNARDETLNSDTLQNEIFYGENQLQGVTVEVDGITYVSSTAFGDSNEVVHKHSLAHGWNANLQAGWYELYGELATITTDAVASTDNTDAIMGVLSATVSTTGTYSRTEIVVFGFTKQLAVQESLDANIQVGLFRMTDEQNSRQLTQITEVTLNMEDAVGAQTQIDDWMLDYEGDVVDDWMLDYATEFIDDWGFALQPNSIYQQSIKGTLDGELAFEDQNVALDEISISGKAKFTTCDVVGLYNIITITAQNQTESFHLKDLELTGYLDGRI